MRGLGIDLLQHFLFIQFGEFQIKEDQAVRLVESTGAIRFSAEKNNPRLLRLRAPPWMWPAILAWPSARMVNSTSIALSSTRRIFISSSAILPRRPLICFRGYFLGRSPE